MHPLLNIAISAARAAGDVIVRNLHQLSHVKVGFKHNQEIFSEVDVKAEQAIIQVIRKAYPNHGILAEESGLQSSDDEVMWIIDPIDGTNNFLKDFPMYAVSIGIQTKGRLTHGVIFDPLRRECFYASRGNGAFLNDRRIRVSDSTQLADAFIGMSSQSKQEDKLTRFLPIIQSVFMHCGMVRKTGSSALDLAYVASGRLDGLLTLGLRQWDIAAGIVITQEAGGMVTDLAGGEGYLKTGDVLAGNPKMVRALVQTVATCQKGSIGA